MKLMVTLVISIAMLATSGAKPANHVIGLLKDRNPAWKCGCAFSFAGSKTNPAEYVFAHPYGRGPAWMNIDGKDVELTLTNPIGDSNDWSSNNPPDTTLVYKR